MPYSTANKCEIHIGMSINDNIRLLFAGVEFAVTSWINFQWFIYCQVFPGFPKNCATTFYENGSKLEIA